MGRQGADKFDTTDIQSVSTDAPSTLTADHHEDKASTDVIRRALDKKVHALREMLVVDEDITTELDRVVCRLMSLAIKTSKRKQTPPPARWMQCKLLDLLTLTEKAITRRKTNIIQSSAKNSVGQVEIKEFLEGQKVNDTANSLVTKYNHLIKAVEDRENYDPFDFQFYDELGVQEYFEVLRDFERSDIKISEHLEGQKGFDVKAGELKGNNVDWISADDTEIDACPGYSTELLKSSAGTSKKEGCGRYNNVHNLDSEIEVEKTHRKRSFHKTIDNKLKREDKHRSKKSKPNMLKKICLHKNPSFAVGKKLSFEYGNIALKPKKLKEISSKMRDATAKPIPDDLIKLCRKDFSESYSRDVPETPVHKESTLSDVTATQRRIVADIVTDEKEEKSALWRSVGIDTRADERNQNKRVTESVKERTKDVPKDFQSQSIFLYDINEPSTSKGLRHVSMDVQCGTDPISSSCGSLAPPASLTKLPNILTNGIKISDSSTNVSSKKKNQDFESSTTNDISNFRPAGSKLQSSHIFTKGIKIEDSSEKIVLPDKSTNLGTSTDFDREIEFVKPTRTTKIRIKDSLTELRAKTSTDFGTSTQNTDTMYLEQSNTVGNNTCRRLRAWSPIRRHTGIKIKDSTMDLLSKTDNDFAECPEDYAKTPKSQTPKDRDSLSNLLVNFTCSQDHDCQTSRSNSPIHCYYEKNDFGTSTRNDISEADNEVEYKTINPYSAADNRSNESCIKDYALSTDNAILRHDLRNDRYHLSPLNTHDVVTNSPDINLSIKKLGGNPKDTDLDAKKKVEFFENVPNIKPKPIIKKGLVELIPEKTRKQPFLLSAEGALKDTDKLKNSIVEEKVNNVYITVPKPKLSRGGIHIHSFNEKYICEDIVYLGDWQSQIPKESERRPLLYRTQKKRIEKKQDSDSKIPKCVAKKFCSKKTSKEIVHIQKQEKKLEKKLDLAKKVLVGNTMKMEQIEPIPTSMAAFRVKSRSLTKVSSKLGSSSFTAKNMKTFRAPITRSANVINNVPTKTKLQMRVDKVEPSKVKKSLRKNYVPSYLKKMKALVHESCVEQTSDIKNSESAVKEGVEENVKADLVKFQHKAPVNYVVFRNELDNPDNNRGQTTDHVKVNTNKKSPVPRSSSPLSVTSSTCSSLDSAETVKNVSNWSKNLAKKVSNVPHKNVSGNIEKESNIPIRNKKFTKRCKTRLVKGVSKSENKENIPESSRKCGANVCLQNAKSTYTRRNKNIFMTQYSTTESGLALNTKHSTPHKSSIKIPTIESIETKRPKNNSVLNKKSLQSQDSSCNEDFISENNFSEEDNKMVITKALHPETHNDQPSTTIERLESDKPEDHKLPEGLDRGNVTPNITSTHTSVATAIRQILEERLDYISTTAEDNQDLHDSSSVKSFKTIVPDDIESELDSVFQSEYENCSFDAIAGDESSVSDGRKIRSNDIDFLSFKTTAMSSKQSEYFLADSTYHTANTENSLRDIYERKEVFQNPVQDPLIAQAFSGFSMDTELVIGDQPDFINLIDSETGSINENFARQITSEELYLSSRSSESYNSCYIDEDAVVPNWLFNVISRQQFADNEETRPDMIPLPMAIPEPVYDVNGNMLEPGVGLGAGAGDGRGIHSDHSQDSSGRGSSLTSTESSSGQQSESILIDPSAFTAQYEMFHEPNSGEMPIPSLVVRIDSDEEPTRRPGNETNTVQMMNFHMLGPSDGEADVSSIDTDIHDSSDN